MNLAHSMTFIVCKIAIQFNSVLAREAISSLPGGVLMLEIVQILACMLRINKT